MEQSNDDGGKYNTNTHVVPELGDKLERVRRGLGLSQSECGIPRTTYQHYERGDRNPSVESLKRVGEAFESRMNELRELKTRLDTQVGWDEVREIRAHLNISQERLASAVGVSQSLIGLYERGELTRQSLTTDGGAVASRSEDARRRLDFDELLAALEDEIDAALEYESDVLDIHKLAESSILWDRIVSIHEVEPDYDYVYDLEVEDTHTFVTNNVFSHNSQLLQYVQKIAPRGIYTSGKGATSAGLCVTGDTRIHTRDGFKEIRELACEHHPSPVEENTAKTYEEPLYTYDADAGRTRLRESSQIWRMPEKPCRSIETGRGKSLEASVNTPVMVCGENGIEWKEISNVEEGDYVAVPRYTEVERSSPSINEYTEFMNEKVKLDDKSIDKLVQGLKDKYGSLRNAAQSLDLSEDFIYTSLRRRYIPVEKLEKILDALDMRLDDDSVNITIERAMLRHGDDISIPSDFDADLMYLVGLVFGDGDIAVSHRGGNRGLVRISNSDESLLRRAAEIVEDNFDKQVEIERQEGKVPCIRINSATIARLFENLGMQTPKETLALDEKLTTSEYADAFLRGLMDADGSVSVRDDGSSSIQFSTISAELAEQVQLMLETYGVYARRRERDRRGQYELEDGYEIESKKVQHHIEIYGRNVDEYAERIGFESESKKEALAQIVGSSSRRDDTVPIGKMLTASEAKSSQNHRYVSGGSNPGRFRADKIVTDVELGSIEEQVSEVVNSDLRWEEVVSAQDTGKKEVFDLTVPDTHNFVANGIVTHNTAAAVQDDFGDG
ncbi:MAG: LAGLIDADG family homing endonuclease, partial [Halobacteria archaeon]|nr:LAGLIDADG family homing endonuclease [Halobacteria archaeon]